MTEESNERSIIGMPTAAVKVGEERMWHLCRLGVLAIERLGENAYVPRMVGGNGVRRGVDAVLSG